MSADMNESGYATPEWTVPADHQKFRLRRQLKETAIPIAAMEELSTEDIVEKLQGLGIPLTEERFVAGVNAMAEAMPSYTLLAQVFMKHARNTNLSVQDADFIYLAAEVLWKRLTPEVFAFERIDDEMQRGYDCFEADQPKQALQVWWDMWQQVIEYQDKVSYDSIDALDKDADDILLQSLSNWCSEFDEELQTASMADKRFGEMRRQFNESLEAHFAKTKKQR